MFRKRCVPAPIKTHSPFVKLIGWTPILTLPFLFFIFFIMIFTTILKHSASKFDNNETIKYPNLNQNVNRWSLPKFILKTLSSAFQKDSRTCITKNSEVYKHHVDLKAAVHSVLVWQLKITFKDTRHYWLLSKASLHTWCISTYA